MKRTIDHLLYLDNLAKTEVVRILNGSEPQSSSILEICEKITEQIDVFISPDSGVDISDKTVLLFLKSSLPVLVEALIRRKTQRVHEEVVLNTLKKVAQMLAQPAAHDMVELCELRNFLLLNNCTQPLKFINPRLLRTNNTQSPSFGPNFFAEFGRPSTAVVGAATVSFWADDWEQVLGKTNAIGHYVAVLEGETWREGKVVGYDELKDSYQVETDAAEGESVGNILSVSLRYRKHHWTDLANRDKQTGALETQLDFVAADVGKFLRVWWPRYNRYFYGRVAFFNDTTKQHSVVYEDGDMRAYDMSAKEYQMLEPPPEVLQSVRDLKSGKPLADMDAAKAVSQWHRRSLETKNNSAEQVVSEVPVRPEGLSEGGTETDLEGPFAVRPPASHAFGLSTHQVTLVNEYFQGGGTEAMFLSLTDSSQQPPLCKIIALHLQLLLQLRPMLGPGVFADLVWDLKEGIPCAFMRYEDQQIKELQLKDFHEVYLSLRDIVMLSNNSDTQTLEADILNSLEILRLLVADKLLVCSQLQKRYLGLSMIQAMLEHVAPRLENYVSRRYQALGINRSFKPTGTTHQGSSGRMSFPTKARLAAGKMDVWLLEHGIFETLFGESLHQDLVAKADLVLTYMAHRQLLTERHLGLMWKSCRGVHEAVVRVVHQLILLLVPVLEPKLRMYMFSLMAAVPAKECTEQILNLIKAYTVQSLAAFRDEDAKQGKSASTTVPQNEASIDKNFTTESLGGVEAGARNSGGRRGLVMHAPQRQWMGFGVLWQFVQDPSADPGGAGTGTREGLEEGLMDQAIQLLVDLLQEEFRDERELVMQRCLDNIQMGVSVPSSLQILRRTLALYPLVNKNWFVLWRSAGTKVSTVGAQIECLIKSHQLLEIVFGDLEKFYRSTTTAGAGTRGLPPTPDQKEQGGLRISTSNSNVGRLGERKALSTGKLSRASHLKDVTERLDFLKFVLSRSNVKLSLKQTLLLWKSFAEGAASVESLDKLFLWLDSLLVRESKLLNSLICSIAQESDPTAVSQLQPSKLAFLAQSLEQTQGRSFGTGPPLAPVEGEEEGAEEPAGSAFEEGVWIRLFEDCLVPWAFLPEKVDVLSRLPVANLCLKTFLLANISNKSLRVEPDGSWSRVGQPVGMPLLWRLTVDTTDYVVGAAAATLLVELNHRASLRYRVSDTVKSVFLRHCFKYLYFSMQCVESADQTSLTLPEQESGANRVDEWFEGPDAVVRPNALPLRVSRLVTTLQLFLQRFFVAPAVLCSIKVLTGRDESAAFTAVLRSADQVALLRQKVAQHFKEPEELILLLRPLRTQSLLGSTTERLDRDELTLQQAKLLPVDSVIARRKEATEEDPDSQKHTNTVAATVPDLFHARDLDWDFGASVRPLSWLGFTDPGVDSAVADRDYPRLFALPPSPLDCSIKALMRHIQAEVWADSRDAAVSAQEQWDRVTEALNPFVRNNPSYVDQLLEMLDGFLSADSGPEMRGLSAVVWDVLMSLPTHPLLLQKLRRLNLEGGQTEQESPTTLSQLLTPNCPYRLLYSLRIIESILSSEAERVEWALQFFHMGGTELLLSLLSDTTDKVKARLQLEGPPPAATQPEGDWGRTQLPREDVMVMTVAMLSRVLHLLMLLDPLYRSWHCFGAPNFVQTPEAGSPGTEQVPEGVLFSCVDSPRLVTQLFHCLHTASQLADRRAITTHVLAALVDNALLFLLGLVTTHEQGLTLLQNYQSLQRLLHALCVDCPSIAVRRGSVQRLFECCCCVFVKCMDPLIQQSNKVARLEVFDYLLHLALTCAHSPTTLEEGTIQSSAAPTQSNLEQLLNLIAGIESLRAAPHLIFPDLKSATNRHSLVSAPALSVSSAAEADSPPDFDFGLLLSDNTSRSSALIQLPYVLRLFVRLLVTHVSSESFHSEQADGALLGLLRVLLVLADGGSRRRRALGCIRVQRSQSATEVSLVGFLYQDCLFPSDSGSGEVKIALCQTPPSRQLVYALLLRLCESDTANLGQLMHVMGMDTPTADGEAEGPDSASTRYNTPVKSPPAAETAPGSSVSPARALMRWNYDPGTLVKDPSAFVGLCNQGGTCYMNSFIQQLFHLPAFRDGILGIQGQDAGVLDENEEVLFQLQVMFGYMRLSQKRFYDTLPFCQAFKDYDGQPISLVEQKDINEFAGMLFDKLEVNAVAKALLKNTIQGQLVWKTKSLENEYRSEREEDFYMITVEVKDKASLEDSLELTVAEELFSGDNKIEDHAGRKVDALRRCALRTLPPTLILHLKRFEFDLETMDRKKVNDEMRFPLDLDMFPYTEEGLAEREAKAHEWEEVGPTEEQWTGAAEGKDGFDDLEESPMSRDTEPEELPTRREDAYYQYSLRGVVAHVGAIDRGHYYSFIQERASSRWLEFNDRSVQPFNPDAIPAECFGGVEDHTNNSGQKQARVRENNAYILVYERSPAVLPSTTAVQRTIDTTAGSKTDNDFEPPGEGDFFLDAEQDVGFTAEATQRSETPTPHTSLPHSVVVDSRPPSSDLVATPPIAERVLRAVRTENQEFLKDRFLFHPMHFRFLWQLQHTRAVAYSLVSAGQTTGRSEVCSPVVAVEAEHQAGTALVAVEGGSEGTSQKEAPVAVDPLAARLLLKRLCFSAAQFVVEVLVRARAQSCVGLFVERLEEVVVGDRSRSCALALLLTLAAEGIKTAPLSSPATIGDLAGSGATAGVRGSPGTSTQRVLDPGERELSMLEQRCHPWLLQMFLFCPHTHSARAFARLVLTCAKSLQPAPEAIEERPSGALQGEGEITVVAVLTEKLLFLAERARVLDQGRLEGYEELSRLLLEISRANPSHKELLIRTGAIRRMVCSVLASPPNVVIPTTIKNTNNTGLTPQPLRPCVELVSALICHCENKPRNPARATGEPQGGPKQKGTIPEPLDPDSPMPLRTEDLQAFLNKVYLEAAVSVSASETSKALQHVCTGFTVKESMKIVDYLVEKLVECTLATGGTLAVYSNFVEVLSDLFLGPLADMILDCQPFLTKIATKAKTLAGRQQTNDPDFVLAICRLLQRIDDSGVAGHQAVNPSRHLWGDLPQRVQRQLSSQAQGPGRGQGGHKSLFEKAAASATAFFLS